MQPVQARVDPGASVDATDGRFGTVEEVIVRPETGELAYLVVRRGWSDALVTIPAALIQTIASPRDVRLRTTREQARDAATVLPREALLASDRGGELHIPVVEERLVAGKRQVDLGELRVHKRVETTEQVVRQPVTRDDLVVERVPINRPLEAPAEPRMEGDWLVIPIMEEVLVVQKRLMLAEEVRIRKRQVTEDQELRELVRHEQLTLEDATTFGVEGLRAASATRPISVASDVPLAAPPPRPPLSVPPPPPVRLPPQRD